MDKNQYPEAAQARVQHFAAATLLPLWIDGQHQRMFEEIDDYRGDAECTALLACLAKELRDFDLRSENETDEVGRLAEVALNRIFTE